MSLQNPRVFISYAHENEAHVAAMAQLAEWLLEKGVLVITDAPYTKAAKAPPKGWTAWMQHEIEAADMVLIVCSPRYKARFERREEPGIGRGSTFESVIITQELYAASMENGRMVPIIPDEGDDNDLPVILKDYSMYWRFPSQNDQILTAIRDEIVLPGPKGPFPKLPPGQLLGPADNRLTPREGKVYGREKEIAQVLAFLQGTENSAVVTALLTGAGGIGKTEVCKAAMKAWLATEPPERCFFIKLPDIASAAVFTAELAKAFGYTAPDSFEQLLPRLPQGLYYLDNMEGLAEDAEAIDCLDQLMEKPGNRVLLSSRVELDRVIKTIAIGKLPLPDAVALFKASWTRNESLQNYDGLENFIEKELGCHPLCIVLMARLGRTYGFTRLVEKWDALGVVMATGKQANPKALRQTNLQQSLLLSSAVLESYPGCLLLWGIAALFPDGIAENLLPYFEKENGLQDKALQQLTAHHILERVGDRFTLLPPLARFALDEALAERNGFSWEDTKNMMYSFFATLGHGGENLEVIEAMLKARRGLLDNFNVAHAFIIYEVKSARPDVERLSALNISLLDIYIHRSFLAKKILHKIYPILTDTLEKNFTLFYLSLLEFILGNIDASRDYLDQVLSICRRDRHVRMAELSLKVGVLMVSIVGDLEKAHVLYEDAINSCKRSEYGALFAFANLLIGKFEVSNRNFDLAHGHFSIAYGFSKKMELVPFFGVGLVEFGVLEMLRGRFELARSHFEEAIGLYKLHSDNIALAGSVACLGLLELHCNNKLGAIKCFHDAVNLLKAEECWLALGRVLLIVSTIVCEVQGFESAKEILGKTYHLMVKERDGLGLALVHSLFGELETKLGNSEVAGNHYRYSIDFFNTNFHAASIDVFVLQLKGKLESALGNNESARIYYIKAVEILAERRNSIVLPDLYCSLGYLEIQVGDFATAIGYYKEALRLYKKDNNCLGLANALKSLGDLERQLGSLEIARGHYESAIELYKQEQASLGLANTLQSLGDAEKEAQQYEPALKYYEEAAALYGNEQGSMGLAYTLAEMVICLHHLGRMEEKQQAACTAIQAVARENIESVRKYLIQCLLETEGSPEAVQRLIEQCMGGEAASS